MTIASASAPDIGRNTLVLMAAGMAGSANIRAFDSALPQMAADFGITLGQTGHFAAVYALAYGLLQIPLGILGDRMDKLRLVRGLAVLSVAVLLLTPFAGGYAGMLALRLIAGAAASAVIPLTIAHIGETVPFERRQVVLAWNMTALITGLVLGQAAGGVIADLVGWQGIPLFIAALYLPAIAALRPEAGPPQARAAPIRPAEALRRIAAAPRSRAILTAAFTEGALIFAAATFFGVALTVRFGLSPAAVGVLLAVYALGSVANLPLVQRWPAAWGMAGHFRLGAVAAAGGLALFALAPVLPLAVAGLFLVGLGAAALHNNLQTCASQMLPEARATGFATFATMFFLSQAAGAAIYAALLDARGVVEMFLWPMPLILALGWWFAGRHLGAAAAQGSTR